VTQQSLIAVYQSSVKAEIFPDNMRRCDEERKIGTWNQWRVFIHKKNRHECCKNYTLSPLLMAIVHEDVFLDE
jgi:hypothetical protein